MARKNYFLITFLIFLSLTCSKGIAQENPPFPVTVEVREIQNAQGLNFGSFTVDNSGGSVFISSNGIRTGETGVHLLNLGSNHHYAIYDIYANPGTLLQILPVHNIPLSGPAGSNVTLSINPARDTNTGQTFITITNPHEVIVGGELKIPPGGGPAGSYHATFNLTFIHE